MSRQTVIGIVVFVLVVLAGCVSRRHVEMRAHSPLFPPTQPVVLRPATLPSYAVSTRPALLTIANPPLWGKRPVWITLNADISTGERAWIDEFREHLTEAPVVLVGHGDTESHAGEWWLCPDIGPKIRADGPGGAIEQLQQRYPDRPIVLISCNAGGVELHTPGVWYSRRKVWSWPGTPATRPSDSAGVFADFQPSR